MDNRPSVAHQVARLPTRGASVDVRLKPSISGCEASEQPMRAEPPHFGFPGDHPGDGIWISVEYDCGG